VLLLRRLRFQILRGEDDKMPNPPPNVLLEVLLTTTDPTRTKNHNVVTL
jgi:hypothetical protein